MKHSCIWSLVLVFAVLAGACSRRPDTSGVPPRGEKVIPNSIGMKLVLIPAGEFMMGSSEPAEELAKQEEHTSRGRIRPYRPDMFKQEYPRHPVRITKPFYLGMYEVTQAEYQRVMGKNPSRFQGDPQRPVENVSWDDAVEFCRTLSQLSEEKAAGAVYRLPTEAEWEYACRAGATTRYSSGDNPNKLGRYAWWSDNCDNLSTRPVGQKKPNAWGLYDMHGNVTEWCADWYAEDYYAKSPVEDPIGPDSGARRVARGGSAFNSVVDLRCANRHGPFNSEGVGFRVARSLTP